MHFNTTDERYHEALRRLAVVLLTLAGIAERAACWAWPVRSLVLWLLQRAETRVRGFAERAGALPLPDEYCALPAGEAARLEQAFRSLAAVFFALSRGASRQFGIWRQRRRLLRSQRNSTRLGSTFLSGFYADTS